MKRAGTRNMCFFFFTWPKARRYLSLFSCNFVNHMTNYMNFKLSKNVEKNPGPTRYNADHHEVIIRPFMQNHRSTMQLTSPISSSQDLIGELGLQSIDVGAGAGDCFFRSVSHQLYGNSNHHMCIRTCSVTIAFRWLLLTFICRHTCIQKWIHIS